MTAALVTGVDCHAHVIDPGRFAFVAGAGYRPGADETGPREAFAEALCRHDLSHAVLVQPSCYAFDMSAMLDAIARSSGRWKGIGVVSDLVDEGTLAALGRQGVVGARVNLGAFDPGFFERPTAPDWLERLREAGWLVQVCARGPDWLRVAPMLCNAGVTVIVDHLGEPDVRAPVVQSAFQAVLDLGRAGRAYAKLSAPYRSSRLPAPYDDVIPFVAATIEAYGADRCLFGSDWPFLNSAVKPSYAEQLAWLEAAVPDAAQRRRILVDNPVALFGFAGSSASGERGALR